MGLVLPPPPPNSDTEALCQPPPPLCNNSNPHTRRLCALLVEGGIRALISFCVWAKAPAGSHSLQEFSEQAIA